MALLLSTHYHYLHLWFRNSICIIVSIIELRSEIMEFGRNFSIFMPDLNFGKYKNSGSLIPTW